MSERKGRIVCAAGARPNFMKIAPILDQIDRSQRLEAILVHTGQHYDSLMSDAFFEDLGIRPPDAHLGVGSEPAALQTAHIIERFDPVLSEHAPDCVLVVGDVNSTLSCGLAAAKNWIPVAHVEAGLRSRDRTMPEELNRMLTDALSDLLFTTSTDADANLVAEGVDPEKIFCVGNVMIDSLLRYRDRAKSSTILTSIGLESRSYALVTLHRPSNVDRKEDLERVVAVLEQLSARSPVVFPVHPRTDLRLRQERFDERLRACRQLFLLEPVGYIDFVRLLSEARVVLTDSGGIQEETTVLGIPCLTMRPNTERPITITQGTNRLVGSDPAEVLRAWEEEISSEAGRVHRIPDLWDGKAAERIVSILEARFGS